MTLLTSEYMASDDSIFGNSEEYDAQYVRRFAKHFGLVLGLKAGIGPVGGFKHGSPDNDVPPTDGPVGPNGEVPTDYNQPTFERGWMGRIKPALTVLLYTGFSF